MDSGTPDAGPVFHPIAHAHNDYEHPRPLLDALDHRFGSVEADVQFDGGQILVTHGGPPYVGTLQGLYLDPLAARVTQNGGSVHGDGLPFFLWIDLKGSQPGMDDALVALLAGYPMLSAFDEDGGTPGPVTLVLTGNGAMKDKLVARPAPRRYVRDGDHFTDMDGPADSRWQYYGLDFLTEAGWDLAVPLTTPTLNTMRRIALLAHRDGRRVRYWRNPDEPAYWAAAADAGIDFIGTDLLQPFSDFFDAGL